MHTSSVVRTRSCQIYDALRSATAMLYTATSITTRRPCCSLPFDRHMSSGHPGRHPHPHGACDVTCHPLAAPKLEHNSAFSIDWRLQGVAIHTTVAATRHLPLPRAAPASSNVPLRAGQPGGWVEPRGARPLTAERCRMSQLHCNRRIPGSRCALPTGTGEKRNRQRTRLKTQRLKQDSNPGHKGWRKAFFHGRTKPRGDLAGPLGPLPPSPPAPVWGCGRGLGAPGPAVTGTPRVVGAAKVQGDTLCSYGAAVLRCTCMRVQAWNDVSKGSAMCGWWPEARAAQTCQRAIVPNHGEGRRNYQQHCLMLL